jgi:hypothetical protein
LFRANQTKVLERYLKKEIIKMSNSTFSSKFVTAVRSILMTACADGGRITRDELCEALETDGFSVSPAVLGLAVQDGVFNTPKQAWNLFAGRFGGIRELDLEATMKAQAEFEAKAASIRSRIEKAMATKTAKKAAKEVAVQASV